MSFEQVRADWTRLGAEDPLWAVLVEDGKRGGRWDVDDFLALGRADVDRARGTLAYLHVPTRPLWTFRGVVWRCAPGPLVRWAQRTLLGYPAPMRMTGVPEDRLAALVAAAGGAVVASVDVDEPETHWHARRYVVRR